PVDRRKPAGLEGGVTAGLETCAAIAGLDTNDGLSRVAGNQKLYLKLLHQFVEQQGPAIAQVTAALSQGDVALAERLAHTLKGVAGNIAAKTIQTTASALEKKIRDHAPAAEVDAAKQQAAAALDPVIAELRSALDSSAANDSAPASTPPTPADPAQARAAAAQ